MSLETTPPTGVNGVIADRTYRNYDGPLRTPVVRFWPVALAVIRTNIRKPLYWVLAALIFLVHAGFGVGLYFTRTTSGVIPKEAIDQILPQDNIYARFCFNGIWWTSLFVFLSALVVGAGSIAADNQANALLVYLSKPFSKADYLWGKFVGVLTMVALPAFGCAMLFYLFLLTAYYNDGFLKDNPYLFPRLFLASLIAPLLNTSLVVGFSAWSKSARGAGAAYAGLYFITYTLATIFGGLMRANAQTTEATIARKAEAALTASASPTPEATPRPKRRRGPRMGDQFKDLPLELPKPEVYIRASTIQHLCITGISDGLAENLLHVDEANAPIIRMPDRMRLRMKNPESLPLAGLAMVLLVAPIVAARVRVRAVEVVNG